MYESPVSETRHQAIARQLREELLGGRYGEEGRLPSEAQLVRRFGVSRPTAARALRSLVEEGLIERRAGSGTFAKPGRGRGGASASSGLLALLIPDLGNTEIFQIIGGEIANLARVHDYSLVWGGSDSPRMDSDLSLAHAEKVCAHFIERRVCGVFFAPYELISQKDEINRYLATKLRDAGIPVVLLDRDLTAFPMRSDFDVVSVDNIAGGYLLGEHLLKLGCQRLHFVSRPHSAPSVSARATGILEALRRRKIEPAPNWTHIGELDDKTFVRSLITASHANSSSAFLCANDHTAATLLQVLHQNRIRVPEDVLVVGFDDVKFATLVSPPLTTVQRPCRDLAFAAFRAMLDRQADPSLPPRQISVAPRLVVRDSCGAYLHRAG